MTMCAEQTPRQNSAGDPCPPWCVTEHEKYNFHGSELITGEAPQFSEWRVRAIRHSGEYENQISIGHTGLVNVAAVEAEDLAALVEAVAEATPEQHRQLAAAIRQAAAVITEEDR